MEKGSIVARTVEISDQCRYEYAMAGIKYPAVDEPCVVSEGPYWGMMPLVSRFLGITVRTPTLIIRLEEYPDTEFSACFFSELLPPQEISLSEICSKPKSEPKLQPA